MVQRIGGSNAVRGAAIASEMVGRRVRTSGLGDWLLVAAALAFLGLPPSRAWAGTPAGFNPARAFGAREDLWGLSLSPDGTRVAYLAPAKGQGATLIVAPLGSDARPMPALRSDGNPFRLQRCAWVSAQRLVCQLYGIVRGTGNGPDLLPVSRWIAVNADGSELKTLSAPRNDYSRGYLLNDGEILDYLPDEDGAVLMSREHLPDSHLGSRFGSDKEGLGVDRVDTRTLKVLPVIEPHKNAFMYLSDGRGTVRIMGVVEYDGRGYTNGKYTFYYRAVGATDWRKLSQYDALDRSGFQPLAVDHDLNVAYGTRRTDGRKAIYTVKLDESLAETLVYAHPDVDVDELLRVGRQRRVVGAIYSTDRKHYEVFDPSIKALLASLGRALPQQPLINVRDASVDESKLIVFASADSDPGVYYVFDRTAHRLATFSVVRGELEGVTLARVRPITYPSSDGVMVPGYLTLPPGRENSRGLPALVLPHGGPGARDEWGFDWLSQYFANRGYVVLQPEFRGSAGYGDAWFQQNGFRSWRVAIGDVLSAGHWLVSEGIADPAQLGILGWSYGGYAALQATIVDPSMFKAVVAVAPVTDLAAFIEEHRKWSNYDVVRSFVGEGPHLQEGSPIEHVKAIRVPVLLVHGTLDLNVGYEQSKQLAEKLQAAGVRTNLVTFKDLDHHLEDADARAELLQRSDDFLRAAFRGGAAHDSAPAIEGHHP